ncbi:hypothetical protein WMY93_000601 [Mugilogobius chulae]|uniref:ribonuclease H n=1 Tax=Mugilogobius chulae TaxID=88201 RepID=A0AAW0Q0V6_9GOBI
MQPDVRASESTRPKRSVQPPSYLDDYDVSYTRAQRANTVHPSKETTKIPAPAPEGFYSPISSRSSSPVSQHKWLYTMDEWRSSMLEDMEPDRAAAAVGGLHFSSPYQRSREPSPTPQEPRLSHYQPPAAMPSQSVEVPPPIAPRRRFPQRDTVSSYDYIQGKQRPTNVNSPAEPAVRQASMIDTLDKLMSELRLLKEQAVVPSGLPYPPREKSAREYYGPIEPQSKVHYSHDRFPPQEGAFVPLFRSVRPEAAARDREPIRYQSQIPAMQHEQSFMTERTYKGPVPSIPNFTRRDPGEFARLKIALNNLLPEDSTELFKFQILMDHLKLEDARLIADAYLNSPTPYTDTIAALTEKFGQPHQLALQKIAKVMDSPDIKRGDSEGFERFALQIRALVGMLQTLGTEGKIELRCGSHVSRLLSKLPTEMRSEFRRHMCRRSNAVYDLIEFSEWLQVEAWCQTSDGQKGAYGHKDKALPKQDYRRETKPARSATILHGAEDPPPTSENVSSAQTNRKGRSGAKAYCPYCDTEDHFLSECATFKCFDKAQMTDWIKTNKRCWRCGRSHQAAQCNLKKPCSKCQGKHLLILHEVNSREPREGTCLVSSATETLYLDKPSDPTRVLLKVIRVLLRHGDKTLDTYAVLDDGSDRTMLFTAAAQQLEVTAPWFSRTFLSIATLKRKYKHLTNLPLQAFSRVSPLLLIGADHPHLLCPIERVRLGPPGGPAAIHTRLGWTLQGPARILESQLQPQQCLFTSLSPEALELKRNVERLWQVDILPFKNEKEVTRSKEDTEALNLLQAKTKRVVVNGTLRYATPLLRKKDSPLFQATKEAVLPSLRNMERRLARDPAKAAAYSTEMEKLETAGVVAKIKQDQKENSESWFFPHHMVQHNMKNRIVFNCSFCYKGLNLNEWLLPGPTLSPSLVGVLLRFREHNIAISGDIKGMFHQVCLLPEDKPLMRFIWRSDRDKPPDIYEWQVLPFGTTCSPCCASFALQQHVIQHSQPEEDVRFTVEQCFYVDNCLQSVTSVEEARQLVDKLRALLALGGFDIRQWASNKPEVICHLPPEARSYKLELWLSHDKAEAQESTLGLSWHCDTDTLGFKHRPIAYDKPTMRNIYRTLASQYDPLGYILPFTTRAKVIVQQLWAKHRDWDDTQLPEDLLQQWLAWEKELRIYPRLLCQDATQHQVFVGTRIAEIQDLTEQSTWRYVDSSSNPSDDLTRGRTLPELVQPNRWSQGPGFLLLPADKWPVNPSLTASESAQDSIELKRSALCNMVVTNSDPASTNQPKATTWQQLIENKVKELHGAAVQQDPSLPAIPPAEMYKTAEQHLFQSVQKESFTNDYYQLKNNKPLPTNSHLSCLSPQYDQELDLIRVGGRLRQAENIDAAVAHPIVLDPSHPYTKLLIKDFDARLCHPGPERVFAELHRSVWILRGREAVRRHQHGCLECRRWRAKTSFQQMADLPVARLRLFKPAFYSTGMDCFGPFLVKLGRRQEKRWGILFKCLTTRAVHIDLLSSIDTDSFLMAFRRFIARRGRPAEVYSDQGTNFKGGERELREAFTEMSPELQEQLAKQQITFRFNPPAAPHFGGVWEREIRSIKTALYTTIASQSVKEEVLQIVLVEIESILNAKPLGYVSSDISDVDPVTPNYLLMGRPDSSLPQVVYPDSEMRGRRSWRHSQVLADHFWSAFIRDYLPSLQTRSKWRTPVDNIAEGAVVLLADPQIPRGQWKIGQVTKVMPGPDGLIRTAEVKIEDRTYVRPIVRLIVLPQVKDEDGLD